MEIFEVTLIAETFSHQNATTDVLGQNKIGPDTRPIPVVDRWAGVGMIVSIHFPLEHYPRTDGRTNRRMDGRTYPLKEPPSKRPERQNVYRLLTERKLTIH